MRRFAAVVFVAALTACSGNGVPIPAAVAALQKAVSDQLFLGLPAITVQLINLLPVFIDPEAAAAAGVTFEPDPQGPPNSYLLTVPVDSDGDGQNDSVVTGTVLLSGDPTTDFGPGFTADLDITLDRNGGEAILNAQLHFLFTANGVETSGMGDYFDTPAATQGTFAIDAADPLVINAPAAGTQGNLCGADAQGPVQIVAGPLGTPHLAGLAPGFYEALWNFLFGSRNVRLTNGQWNNPAAGQTAVPDSTVQLPACGPGANLTAWLGSWTFDWFCTESGTGPGGPQTDNGQSAIQITQTGPNTLRIADDSLVYFATVVGGNPLVVAGTFQDTDGGGTYTENFTWTLNAAGTTWTQTSSYLYSSGILAGTGGDCYGTATR